MDSIEYNTKVRHPERYDPEIFEALRTKWWGMKQRCTDKKNKRYHDWGGRGITICKEWHSLETFMDWSVKNGYKIGLQIDRIDNDGNYEPSNCRYVTASVNMANRGAVGAIDIVGVSYDKSKDRYTVKIAQDGVTMYIKHSKDIDLIIHMRNRFIERNNLPHVKSVKPRGFKCLIKRKHKVK